MEDVKGLMKKNDEFEKELDDNRERWNDICRDGEKMIDDGNNNYERIDKSCKKLKKKMDNMEEMDERRKEKIMENYE